MIIPLSIGRPGLILINGAFAIVELGAVLGRAVEEICPAEALVIESAAPPRTELRAGNPRLASMRGAGLWAAAGVDDAAALTGPLDVAAAPPLRTVPRIGKPKPRSRIGFAELAEGINVVGITAGVLEMDGITALLELSNTLLEARGTLPETGSTLLGTRDPLDIVLASIDGVWVNERVVGVLIMETKDEI
jgi:hypothetical protein